METASGAVGVSGAVFVEDGDKNSFSLDQPLGKGSHHPKNGFEIESFADGSNHFLKQGDLLVTVIKFILKLYNVLIQF
jgi:hypothetical protein